MKTSAIGSSFFVGQYDLSGGIGAVTGITASQAVQDVSSIRTGGTERLGLRQDGSIAYASFWNPDAGAAVAILSAIGESAVLVSVPKGPGGLGTYVAHLKGVRVTFSTANGADGSLGSTGETQASAGIPLEWGRPLTADDDTFAATQLIASWQTDHVYALNAIIQPTTPNGHYYKATTGGTSAPVTEPTFPTNGSTVADGPDTLIWTDQGLIANRGIDRGVGSASDFGAAAYLHAFSIGSGSATIIVQDSSDRIAWAVVPGLSFATVSAATSERVVTSTTENVKRYVRAYVTGTFTNLVAAVSVVVYKIAQ